jgi:hypothetical protein
MPGSPQNNNFSSLSFSGTKALRDLLLTKNLPNPEGLGPYGNFTNSTYSIASFSVKDVIDQPSVEVNSEMFLNKLYLNNAYGPEGGYSDFIKIYTTSQGIAKVNEGEYPDFTPPETGAGLFGENPFRIVARYYSPMDILLGVSAEGLLSQTLLQDSPLQQAGARQLRFEFQERIAQELYQETIGRLSFVDALQDPIDALDIVTGRQPLINRDYTITQPKSLVGQGLDFVSRLTGIYVPYSYIPGDYFELEPPRGLSSVEKSISDITGILGSLVGIPRRRQSPSQRFLEYTGGGTKSKLFKAIRYNKYGPQYGEGAQAQTAIGAAFGEVIDFVGGGILGFGNNPPNLPQYIGGPRNRIADMTSPPDNTYAGKNYVQMFGPDAVAKEFDSNEYEFGMRGRNYSDQGNVPGGFTWFTDKTPGSGFLNSVGSLFNANANSNRVGPQEPGATQGPEGSTDNTTRHQVPNSYDDTKSTNYKFRQDSLMDTTQQIIDSVPKGGAGLKSVSHAMNQVSKVFNDGYKELTKGSRVKKFVNTDATSGEGIEQSREYCRVWTKDVPYYAYDRLVRFNMNHRKETYSVLDSPYNLNIAPHRTDESGKGSSNIVDGKVKKYMFSLENLAWRTSGEPGFTYDDLPSCEKGPNGGRIMWFPPYDLSVDEASSANWTENNFLGRPEPIYTYNNTNRTGSLRFKIVVDHPSVLNLLVRKELQKLGPEETDAIVDSFFAGCKKYDIFDLARKWKQFSVNELESLNEQLNTAGLTDRATREIINESATENPQETNPTPLPELQSGLYFFFDNDYPDTNTNSTTSTVSYVACAEGSMSQFGQYLVPGASSFEEYINSASEADKPGFRTFFTEDAGKNGGIGSGSAYDQYNNVWPQFARDLKQVLDSGLKNVTLIFDGSSSSIATSAYNKNLSQRRLDSVIKMFDTYEIDGKKAFKQYREDGTLKIPDGNSMGESQCNVDTGGTGEGEEGLGLNETGVIGSNTTTGTVNNSGPVYSAPAAGCRYVTISSIEYEDIAQPEPEPEPKPPVDRKRVRPIQQQEQLNIENDKNTRREIANKVLMKMVTECDYFDMIQEENEFIYDSLKQKFKFFHPAFHAITPEGLNSRLTFLNQCVRPGATIPTATKSGTLNRNADAKNTSFGAPPICILRIGDFYHTKIAIDQVSFTYDENLLDLNPEGIGVQPMLATVSLNFKYIGGQGLKEPVSQLQNALSFNFFGNTEMYDDRAVLTVTDDNPDEKAWIQENSDLIGNTGLPNPEGTADETDEIDTSANDGITIGDRTNSFGGTTGQTGTINYKNNWVDLSTAAYEYINSTNNDIFDYVKNQNYVGLQIFFSEKEMFEGEYYSATAVPGSFNTNNGKLIGKSKGWETRLKDLEDLYKFKITDGTTYIQNIAVGLTSSQEDSLKEFLQHQLVDSIREYEYQFTQLDLDLKASTLKYVKHINSLNIVNKGGDGYGENGKWTTLKLSGGTDVYPTVNGATPPTNTLVELGDDYKNLTNLITFYSQIYNGDSAGLIIGNTLLDVVTAKLTAPNQFSVGWDNISNDLNSPISASLTPFIMEYYLFGNKLIDQATVDSLVNTNIQPFKDNNNNYVGQSSFIGEMVEALYPPPQMTPLWVDWFKNEVSEYITLNEDFYIRKFLDINDEFLTNVTPEGISTLSQGLTELSYPANLTDLKDDKKREMTYEQVTDQSIEADIRVYSSKRSTGPDSSFNLKFF